jgi:hypothetical protein
VGLLNYKLRINKDFEDIAKTRNAFAHKLTITPTKEDVGKHLIVLKEFKNASNIFSYTENDLDEMLALIEKYSVMIKNRNNPQTSGKN